MAVKCYVKRFSAFGPSFSAGHLKKKVLTKKSRSWIKSGLDWALGARHEISELCHGLTSDILRRRGEPSPTWSVIPDPSLIFMSEMKHSKDKWTGWVRKYAFYLSLRDKHHAARPPPEQGGLTRQKLTHASNQMNFKPYCFILFAPLSTSKFISCIPCWDGANSYLLHEIMLIHELKTRAFFS